MNGTLKLELRDHGLDYEVDTAPTTAGRDTCIYLERRDMTGSSFAFVPKKEHWTEGAEQEGKPGLFSAHRHREDLRRGGRSPMKPTRPRLRLCGPNGPPSACWNTATHLWNCGPFRRRWMSISTKPITPRNDVNGCSE